MSIERTTSGLIEAQFIMLDEVAGAEKLSLQERVTMTSKLVGGIRGIAALNLAHMREVAKAPQFASKPETMQLVNGDTADAAD